MTSMIVQTANAARLAQEAFAEVIKPAPPVDYLKYAEEKVYFSERESPFPGPYNREIFIYFDEILRALSPDDPCRIVSMSKSAQLGGTVLANIFICGSLEMDPGDIMMTHPTEGNAKRWSKMKLAPMLRNSVSLRALFPANQRDGADSVLYKERVDGRGAIQISGANSPASLSQVSMKRQVQDDLAKWETNAGGDPESQADSRSQAFEFAKIFKISTPLVMPGCRITRSFEEGSQELPYVPCPHCGHSQVLEWENMLENLDEDHPEKACFHCVECGSAIQEHHRPQMLKGIEWIAQNPKAKRHHRSFWIWSAYSYLQTFERIARAWLKAKGDPASEQTFLNDTVGKAYQTQGEAPPWEELRDRGAASDYPRGRIPAGALVITIGIDCQDDRVEWQVVGWGRNRERYAIQYGVFPGHISEEGCREKLDALIRQSWPNAYGRKISADRVGIDGNAFTEDVWDWVKKHPASLVMMVRGNNSDNAPLIMPVKKERHKKTGKILKWSKRFYSFNASVMKMALYRNCRKEDPLETGYIAFPSGFDDEYYRQLTAERRVSHKNKDGFDVYKWEKDPTQANEALDTMNQAEAAAIRFGVRDMPEALWNKYEAERETYPEEAQGDLEDLFSQPIDPQPTDPAKKPKPETGHNKWRRRLG
ncbi:MULTISPECIES: phage terminase large subunit family protein [unclassified Roseibium]|uniref:phage terminase large subunit family protein n=1 Tax=unclassified Roseibium TaxID=2629323 RepID=UPI00273D1E73|nr:MULTISPECIES: terminase gpA endonuclease subunit [unclassified Roseibium]